MTHPLEVATPAQAADVDEPDALLNLLQSVARRLVAMTASALLKTTPRSGAPLGLSEYRVLVLLAGRSPRRPSELADELGVTRPAVAQILGRLEAAHLVSRRIDRADRRSSKVSLTAKGGKIVDGVLRAREEKLLPALAALRPDDRQTLTHALSRLDGALAERHDRA